MEFERNRLLVVDGHAVAYRAFYAIRELSTRDGVSTNAVFGFIRMLDQLRATWSPSHIVVIFDGGLPAARMALLPSYKAQREEMPSSLRGQFALIEEYLHAAGIAWMRMDEEEADDLMATIAAQAGEKGHDVFLATSDKDMFQLVNERVIIVSPTKSDVRMGFAEVRTKTGVSPGLIAEWLALIGDAADNIPGVPGIGPKTAAQLLNQFGSLEQLYARLDEVGRDKLVNALREHRDAVWRNLSMTRLRTDLLLPLQWQEWEIHADEQSLLAFYTRMEFHSMAKALASPTLF
jgi:DNA polymerase I